MFRSKHCRTFSLFFRAIFAMFILMEDSKWMATARLSPAPVSDLDEAQGLLLEDRDGGSVDAGIGPGVTWPCSQQECGDGEVCIIVPGPSVCYPKLLGNILALLPIPLGCGGEGSCENAPGKNG